MKKIVSAIFLATVFVWVYNMAGKKELSQNSRDSESLLRKNGEKSAVHGYESTHKGGVDSPGGAKSGELSRVYGICRSLASLIALTPSYEHVRNQDIYSKVQNLVLGTRNLYSSLNAGGEIFVGTVVEKISESTENDVLQWGFAEIKITETIFGERVNKVEVPYAYEDLGKFKSQMLDGKHFVLLGSIWKDYGSNPGGNFLFVITDGYDPRVFTREEAVAHGLERGAYVVSDIEKTSGSIVEDYRKVAALFRNPGMEETQKIVAELIYPAVDPFVFEFAVEVLLVRVAPENPDLAIKIFDNKLEKFNGAERDRAVMVLKNTALKLQNDWPNKIRLFAAKIK